MNSEKAIVFGEYDIYICYCNNSLREENNYKVKTQRETFCEVVPCTNVLNKDDINIQELEAKIVIPTPLECSHGFSKFNDYNKSLEIKVSGEINIVINLDDIVENNNLIEYETEETVVEKNDVLEAEELDYEENKEIESENREDENAELKVLQFENDIYSLEELMEMDIETLNSINNH